MKGIAPILMQAVHEECFYFRGAIATQGGILLFKGSCAAQNTLQKRIPSMIHFPVPAFCEGAPRTHESLGILHGLPGPTPPSPLILWFLFLGT